MPRAAKWTLAPSLTIVGGKFTEQYPENAFLEAIKRLDTATTTKIAEEVGCSYDLAYRRLNSLLSEEKVERLVWAENKRALEDCGIFCRFSRGEMNEERFEALLDADFDDLLEVGARVVELERHFNNQRGFDRDDDRLPYDLPEFEDALDEYYAERGWNDDGTVPDDHVTGGTGAAPADD